MGALRASWWARVMSRCKNLVQKLGHMNSFDKNYFHRLFWSGNCEVKVIFVIIIVLYIVIHITTCAIFSIFECS